MINPDALLTCDEFSVRSAYFKWLRREQVLPQLKGRKTALKGQIDALKILADWMGVMPTKGLAWEEFQRGLTHNHRREGLLNAAGELYPEYSDVCGQAAVIESEQVALAARVPELWRVQAFEIKGAA